MESGFKVKVFNNRTDSERVLRLVSDIIVNEFEFKLDFDGLDSDISCNEEHYKKSKYCHYSMTKRNKPSPSCRCLRQQE
jgi:hypothetical protein